MALRLVPEGIHLLERHLLEVAATSDGAFLYIVETSDKLLVRALQSIVGAKPVHAGHVDASEEEVTQFCLGKVVVAAVQFGLQLVNLFEQLRPST